MARTKQTARKDTGGKPLAMGRGRGKGTPRKNPPPGGRADRKVVLEYSSDETPDESAPRPAEGAEAPKRVKKQIHLTLPTSPAHVTTTETFTTFFINHGLMRALQKAFAKRGWSTDQMGEFVTNFQRKHGQQVPMPKIYRDEDTSDSDSIELADGTKAAKKTAGGAGGSGGSKPRKKPTAGGSASTSSGGGSAHEGGGPSTSGGSAGGSGGKKRGCDDDGEDDDPNKRRKTGGEGEPPKKLVAQKEPCKKGTVYPPIDRKLPVLYISHPKERTELGHRVLDWTAEQKRDPRGEDAGKAGEAPPVQSGDCGSEGHSSLPREHSTAHPKAALPEASEGDRPGFQDRPAVPVSGGTVSPGGGGGIPCQAVRRC